MLAALLAMALAFVAPAKTEAMPRMHARGSFEVAITPVKPPEGAPADLPGRMTLVKTFVGDLQGTSAGEMLAVMGPDKSGAYVALERVTGALNGRQGSFALVHRGVMNKGAQELLITVVPGSGAGALTGIEGVFHLTIEGKLHRYDLEYSIPQPPA